MRVLFAYSFDPRPAEGETSAERFAKLAAVLAAWAGRRLPAPPPTDPGDHEFAAGDVRVRAVRAPAAGHDLYEVTVTAPDPADPTARRTTTAAVARAPLGLQVAVTEAVSLSRFVLRPVWFDVTRPAVVDDLLKAGPSYLGGFPIPTAPRRLTAHFVPNFIDDTLTDERRALPLVTVSPALLTGRPLVDVAAIQEALLGLAAVVELADRDTTWKLTNIVGKELSCFDGAVRVYWPGFTTDDDPYSHPLKLRLDVEAWEGREPGAVARNLFRTFAGAAVFRFADAPLVRAARDAVAKDRQREAQERVAKLSVGATEQQAVLTELEHAWDEAAALRKKVAELTAELADQKRAWQQVYQPPTPTVAAGTGPAARPTAFKNVAEVVEYAKSAFRDTLVFLPSAVNAAADSPFEQPDSVAELFDALDALVRKWKKDGSLGEDWHAALKKSGFEFKPHISQTAATRWEMDYLFPYEGKYKLFENHVTLGVGPPARCLSVHWLRDDRLKRIAVGWCGRHRTNTLT